MTQINAVFDQNYHEAGISNAGRAAPNCTTFMAPGGISDALLAELLNHGETVPSTKGMPTLPLPEEPVDRPEAWGAVPSLGSSMLQAIVQLSSLMRRQNAQLRAVQLDAMANEMESQAATLHAKAKIIFGFALAASIVSIAAGALAVAGSVKFAFNGLGSGGDATRAMSQALGTLLTGINTLGQGISGGLQGGGQAMGTLKDEEIKQSEARVERQRSGMEYMKSLEDSMRDVISKAIAAQDAIQQNTNQTRTKILG